MSSSGLLSLRWNNHSNTILQSLSNVRNKNHYEDATVACAGKLYPVHRLVLSACSDYFEQMFALTHGKHSVIVLKDVSTEVFEALLSYMYIGKVDVRKEKLGELINAAACLEIRGLAVSEAYEGLTAQHCIKRSIDQVNLHQDSHSSNKIPRLDTDHLDMRTDVPSSPNNIQTNVFITNCKPHSEKYIKEEEEEDEDSDESPDQADDSELLLSSDDHSKDVQIKTESCSTSCVTSSDDTSTAVVVTPSKAPATNEVLEKYDSPPSSGEGSTHGIQQRDTASEEHLPIPSYNSQQEASPEYSLFSPEVNHSEEKFKEGHLRILSSTEVDQTDTFSDYRLGLDSRNVPVFLENSAASSKTFWMASSDELDMSPNLDVHSMLDLHYDTDGNGADEKDAASLLGKTKSPILKQHWQCPQCEYSTPVKQYITQHIRRHTGEKPFKCSLCEYRAAQKQSVTYHMRRHTGEKPFKCTHCDYSSSSRQNLDRHIRRHTGEMPYGCPYCSYRSITKGPVVDHMRAKHGEQDCDKSLVLKLETKPSSAGTPLLPETA